MPITSRPFLIAAKAVVPEPMNGSSTVSPGSVNRSMNHSGSQLGNAALWLRLPHSVAPCSTLVGYTRSRPIQFSTFLPKPLPTLDSSRTRSVSLKLRMRLSYQSPTGTITASWFILNLRSLLNCNSRSQASRKRLGHLPG